MAGCATIAVSCTTTSVLAVDVMDTVIGVIPDEGVVADTVVVYFSSVITVAVISDAVVSGFLLFLLQCLVAKSFGRFRWSNLLHGNVQSVLAVFLP